MYISIIFILVYIVAVLYISRLVRDKFLKMIDLRFYRMLVVVSIIPHIYKYTVGRVELYDLSYLVVSSFIGTTIGLFIINKFLKK